MGSLPLNIDMSSVVKSTHWQWGFQWKEICEMIIKDMFSLVRQFEVVNNLQASFDMISRA